MRDLNVATSPPGKPVETPAGRLPDRRRVLFRCARPVATGPAALPTVSFQPSKCIITFRREGKERGGETPLRHGGEWSYLRCAGSRLSSSMLGPRPEHSTIICFVDKFPPPLIGCICNIGRPAIRKG